MKKQDKAVCRTSIGGQAVLEGVMMKGYHSMATAVRAPSGEITVESKYIKSPKERNLFFRLPFVRGVVNLFTQLVQGTGIIMRSAEVYGDFEEPSKTEKWMAEKLKINPMNLLMTISVLIGVVFAVGLFIVLPNLFASLICNNTAIDGNRLESLYYSLIEGGFMLLIFISYIVLVSLIKDIRRVFMYHGAEHKTISCFEHGLELTVENARKMKREHSRCGTTFLFFTVAVSIIVFVLINFMLSECHLLVASSVTAANLLNALIRLGFKLLFLPVVAGISYELLKLLAKSDALIVRILRAPGMALQLLTTKEPTDDMLEVAITAFKTVQAMDEDSSLPETDFNVSVPYEFARKKVAEIAPCADEADIDWMFVEATSKKRSELSGLVTVSKPEMQTVESIAKKMADGSPLQYALGYCEFLSFRLGVNKFALIPRPETEELATMAINLLKGDESKRRALELCTGSGALAIAVKKSVEGVDVTATDISHAALELARANALLTGAEIKFFEGDMFEPIEGEFDVILANPPYIPSDDIAKLDDKVKNFEPRLALDGGKDGLKFYRVIRENFEAHLKEDGVMLLEFGIDQQDAIRDIFCDFDVEIAKDMSNIDRFAIIKRKK